MPIYKNNAQNRRLKRVGMGYGKSCAPCEVKKGNAPPKKAKKPVKKPRPAKKTVVKKPVPKLTIITEPGKVNVKPGGILQSKMKKKQEKNRIIKQGSAPVMSSKKPAPTPAGRDYIVPLDMFNSNIESESYKARKFVWVNNMNIYLRAARKTESNIIGKMSNKDFEDFELAEEMYGRFNLYDVDLDEGVAGKTRPIFTSYGNEVLKKDGFI